MSRSDRPMPTAEALRVLSEHRGEADVVVTHQGSAREWPKLSRHPLDFHHLPSAMGAAIPLAVGLALAQPDRQIMVVTGEGSLLMNLCALPTIAKMNPSNLLHVVFDNGAYESSGEIKTATSSGTDLVGMARSAGIKNALLAQNVEEFAKAASEALKGNLLTFLAAKLNCVTY